MDITHVGIDERVHKLLKGYTREKGYIMRAFVEQAIREKIEREMDADEHLRKDQ